MVVIKQANRVRSNKQNKDEDDEFMKLMKSFGFKFDNEGRMTNNPFNINMRRSEDERN